MRGRLQRDRDVRAGDPEERCEFQRVLRLHDWIVVSVGDQHRSRWKLRHPRRHSRRRTPEKHRSCKRVRPCQQQRRRQRRPIREADCDDLARIEAVTRGRRCDKCRELRHPALQVPQITRAFGEPAEKAPTTLVVELSTRAQYSGRRQDGLRQRQQFVLVACRAVKQQQRAAVGARRRLIEVREELEHAAIIGDAAGRDATVARPDCFPYATRAEVELCGRLLGAASLNVRLFAVHREIEPN